RSPYEGASGEQETLSVACTSVQNRWNAGFVEEVRGGRQRLAVGVLRKELSQLILIDRRELEDFALGGFGDLCPVWRPVAAAKGVFFAVPAGAAPRAAVAGGGRSGGGTAQHS